MKEERSTILQMVADGVIDAEEAERLLDALAEGQKVRGRQAGSERVRQSVGTALRSMQDALAGVGTMIGDAVGEAAAELADAKADLGLEEEGTEVQLVDGRFRVPPGTRLAIINDRRGGRGGGTLSIEGIDGEFCTVQAENARNLRVRESRSGMRIRWAGGRLRIQVPASAGYLRAATLGGDAELKDLRCEFEIKTMGGDLEALDIGGAFKVMTMGGHAMLTLAPGWQGEGKATTMGGKLVLGVPANLAGTEVKAQSLGGEVEVDPGIAERDSQRGPFPRTARMTLGVGVVVSALRLKTMGGAIRIQEAKDE